MHSQFIADCGPANQWSSHRDVRCPRNDLYCVEWDVKLYYTIPL